MRRILLILAMLFPTLAAAQPAAPLAPTNLTLFADATILPALAPLAQRYARSQHIALTVAQIDPATLTRQVGQGLEAHVVLTADKSLVLALADQGQTDVLSAREVARTQLALVGPTSMQRSDLFARHISFAALLESTPGVPVYARDDASIDGALVDKLRHGFAFSSALDERIETVTDPYAALVADPSKPALALMLATDAVAAPDALILSLLPEEMVPAVRYRAVVLASDQMENARALVKYLASAEAQPLFARYGFQPPKE